MANQRHGLDDFNEVPHTHPADKPRHTWVPSNLITLARKPPEPPTIGGLLYPGKRTLLSGETESLKTWLALILAKAEMEIEIPVAWVDLDDMGAGAILQRLRVLGVPDQTISDFFLYYQPDQRLYDVKTSRRTEILNDVLMQLTTLGARMMVIDAFNPMLSLHGLNFNDGQEIEAFWREIADPIAKTGAAPILLDHVTKSAEGRGKYSIGSERKASGATVHIGAHPLEALTIGGEGRAILTTHKDRPAYLPRPTIGILKLTSHEHGDLETVSYSLEPDVSHTPSGFRPTILMERISRELETRAETTSKNWVEKNIEGKASALRTALKLLVEGGYLTPNTHRSLMPYRQENDPLLEQENIPFEGSSPPRPRFVPNLGSTRFVPSSHPLRGDEGDDPSSADRDEVVPSSLVPHTSSNGIEPEDAGPPDTDWLDSLTSEGGHE